MGFSAIRSPTIWDSGERRDGGTNGRAGSAVGDCPAVDAGTAPMDPGHCDAGRYESSAVVKLRCEPVATFGVVCGFGRWCLPRHSAGERLKWSGPLGSGPWDIYGTTGPQSHGPVWWGKGSTTYGQSSPGWSCTYGCKYRTSGLTTTPGVGGAGNYLGSFTPVHYHCGGGTTSAGSGHLTCSRGPDRWDKSCNRRDGRSSHWM